MMEMNRFYNEDCLETMQRMPDEYVDLTVTSPPYDSLRDYNGYSFDYKATAKALFRITKQGGCVVWVIGDQTKKFCESLSSFKQAIYFKEEAGFNLLDTMIYHKSNYAPAYPNLRRYANTFEYMFVFAKGKPKTFNPVQIPKKMTYKNKNAYFRQKDGSQIKKILSNAKTTKAHENVWTICPISPKEYKYRHNHPAIFPVALAKNHILTWTNRGNLVYDPFAGIGTTAIAAIETKRNYILSECSAEYCAGIRKNLANFF